MIIEWHCRGKNCMKKNIWEEIANQYNISLEEEFIVEEKGGDVK